MAEEKSILDLSGLEYMGAKIKEQLNGKAPSSHNHAASNITSGTLSSDRLPTVPVAKGGTGATTAAAARTNLGITPANIGAAASSHGNHVPATQTANNAVFLRNDNTWQTVTPANIGAAASSHNHAASNITSGTLGVARGGTGKATHTSNAVLTGNGTSAVNNVATASGALYATSTNGAAKFGTLPVAQGGTGATTAAAARTNLGITPANIGAAASSHTHSIANVTNLQSTLDSLQDQIDGGVGKNVAGQSFTVDGTATTAGEGAEIFNNYAENIATGKYAHAEGSETVASGNYSHAEGDMTKATASFAHSEGSGTTASGIAAHAEGSDTVASGTFSHAEGSNTIASSAYQHVQGRYNVEDAADKYIHIVGNGNTNTTRSNAHTVDWNGNAWFAGDVYLGGTSQDSGSSSLTTLLSGKAASSHNHAASAITSGTLGVARGGTGKATHTSNAVLTGNGTSAVNNVATASGALYATSTNGAAKFGTLPIAQGGTGATTAAAARTNLGITPANIGAAASSHGNHVPTTQTANNAVFLRNDNTWQTVTPANIGAAASSHNHAASAITSGTLSSDRLPTVPVAKGGTGGDTVTKARENLGIISTPRNLLDNSDFSDPVAQAGLNGAHGNVAYAVDRWMSNKLTVTQEADNLKATPTDTYAYIRQKVQVTPGKTYTCAAHFSNVGVGAIRIYDEGMTTQYVQLANISVVGLVTFTVPDGVSVISVVLYPNQPNAASGIIYWAALYEGEYTAETLPEYQPKGYAAELLECQRYYYQATGYAAWPAYKSSAVYGFITLPTKMRVTPSVTGTFVVRGAIDSEGNGTTVTVSSVGYTDFGNSLRLSITGDGKTNNQVMVLITKDLEISADL